MKGCRINPAWESAIYQEDFIGADGRVVTWTDGSPLMIWPRRGNEIVNGELVPIPQWIEVDDLPDLSKLSAVEIEKRNDFPG